jgi:hypothetical protein
MFGCKACYSCFTFKAFSEFYNSKQSSDKKYNQCKKCNKEKGHFYREGNRERERIRNRKYGQENSNIVKDRVKRWRKDNPGKERALKKMRETKKLQACPPWAQTRAIRKEMVAHYLHAEWLELVTGESFQVDHIVPLRSDFVCGLHVPANLMVLSAKDNQSKNAYWWPEQLDCQKGRGSSHQWWRDLQ